MNTLEFDQKQFVERMTAAGMSFAQANAQAAMLAEIQNDLVQNWLATKNDLKKMDTRLTREIAITGARVILRMGSLVLVGFILLAVGQVLRNM